MIKDLYLKIIIKNCLLLFGIRIFITCHKRFFRFSIFLFYSDLAVQANNAKFEFNGNTGYLLKPWVMNREGAARGVFNPFVQSKLEDIVPAKLQVKVCIL